MTQNPAPAVAPVSSWDRLVIVALGAAGTALSYDALQQMAVAIHVRGFLTYLFPLVIDGFIAYGVRALLVLSTAPLRARLYVWTLFGTATTASIWANALHAVRLNQQTTTHTGLRLGDTTVAILSTLAPLALAGAVHLYILITRHHPHAADRHRTNPGEADQRTSARPDHTSGPTRGRTSTDADQRTTIHADHVPRSADQPRTSASDESERGPAGQRTTTLADHPAGSADQAQAKTPVDRRTTTGPVHVQGPADQRTDAPTDHASKPEDQPHGPATVNPRTSFSAGHGPSTAQDQAPDQAPAADRPAADQTVILPADQTHVAASADHEREPADQRTTVADHTSGSADQPRTNTGTDGERGPVDQRTSVADQDAGGRAGDERTADHARTGPAPDHPQTPSGDQDQETAQTNGIVGEPVPLERLIPLAREAALREGRLTRRAIRPYLREQGIQISNERFSDLQNHLYADKTLAHLPRSQRRTP